MIGVLILGWTSYASPISVVSKIENEKATVEVSLAEDFETVRKKVGENLDALLTGTPQVKQATRMSSTIEEGPLSAGSSNRKVEAHETLFVKGTNVRLFPESLFNVDRTETNCFSDDCVSKTEVKITGPEADYRTFVDFQNKGLPAGAFELSLAATPVTGSKVGARSKVTISLKIVDRSYQGYLKSLKLGKSTPTELELQKGFMLWAHSVVGRLGGA